ncbi:MAG: VCBS repeat-containing protein [Acidobacteria bacterium]|nr:VCBS repeat-containing protein [Acidobacteriota bacterium]
MNNRTPCALLVVAALALAAAPRPTFRHVIVDPNPPRRPHCKTVGDLNGDGLPDILAASDAGGGLWWYRAPNWSKARIDTGAFTTDIQVGDIDADGDLDIIIPKTGTGVVWYENPSWRLHKVDSDPAHDVEVGDVDRDGRLDIVVRLRDTRVLLQKSPDVWVRVDIPTGGRGGTVLGDIDGDGDLDIAQNGYWLEAPADKVKGVWQRHEIAPGWPADCGVAIADVNKDGRPDILLVPAEQRGRLAWFEAADPKKGPWTEHLIDADMSHVHTFKTADVDRDGNLDVVTAEMEQSPKGRIRVHYNLGKGLKWLSHVAGWSGSHNLRIADIGGDGDLDIIGANHGNHGDATPLDLWENLAYNPAPALALNHWQRHVIDNARPARALFIAPADLDGDGRLDIVTGGWWYRNPGPPGGAWSRKDVGESFRNFALAYDFDGDGDIDLLGSQGEGSQAVPDMVWARNDGRGSFTIRNNIPKPEGDFLQGVAVLRAGPRGAIRIALSWHRPGSGVQTLTAPKDPAAQPWAWAKIAADSQDEALSAGDIGRDVHLDLLLGTRWLRSDGKTWSVETLNPAKGAPDRNRLADINGDGRWDAVVGFEAINVPGKLAWYEQPVDAKQTWTEHVIADVVGPMSVDVGDLDRDGDLDVVVGEHNYKEPATAKLHIFENIDGQGQRWKDHVISTGDEHHDGAVLVDIDGDGDLDILSIGWSHPRVLLYENQAIPAAGARAEQAGRFVRAHWFDQVVKGRVRVNAPEAVLHPQWGRRSETRQSGMMQIRMDEDLFLLDGAELYCELWGGHNGTRNKRVTLNGRTTYAIPEVGTADGYLTHHYPVIPLKLTDLVNGPNAVQFACDQGASFWGHFIVDNAALRVFLKRDHPDLAKSGLTGFGALVTARHGRGESLDIELIAGHPAAIARVEFQGYYDGYDENGDGLTTDWHGFTKARRPMAILGVAEQAPFRIAWDTSMIPPQKEMAVRAVVHFRDHPDLAYITPQSPVAMPARRGATVRQFLCTDLPMAFTSRMNRVKTCSIRLDVDPASIERAELHVVVWDGGRGTVEAYFTLNGQGLPVAGEGKHDTIYSRLPLDPKLLKGGLNHIELRSDTEHHGIEVLRPGPALMVRYKTVPSP